MLLQNLLIKLKVKDDTYKLKKIKTSYEQKQLLKENKPLLHKAFIAQKIYNKGFWFLLISIGIIVLISAFDENEYVYKVGSLLMSAIAIPCIISLAVVSFDQMSEIDNNTLYNETKEESYNKKIAALLKDNNNLLKELANRNEEKENLKQLVVLLTENNQLLKDNLDKKNKPFSSVNTIYSKKSFRKNN